MSRSFFRWRSFRPTSNLFHPATIEAPTWCASAPLLPPFFLPQHQLFSSSNFLCGEVFCRGCRRVGKSDPFLLREPCRPNPTGLRQVAVVIFSSLLLAFGSPLSATAADSATVAAAATKPATVAAPSASGASG